MVNKIKTLRDLVEMVEENERELAPGSETEILGTFVSDFGTTGAILEMDDNTLDREETDAYDIYKLAYDRMRRWMEDGREYDELELWY